MYKYFIFLPLFLLVFATSILAQSDTNTDSNQTTVNQTHENIQNRVEIRREITKHRVEQRRETFEQKIETGREEMMQKHEERSAALKEKLDAFKDKRRAQIADRVSTSLNLINEKRTTAMTRHLAKMDEILDKLQARVDSKDGDKTEANKAIAAAQKAIEAAKNAVAEQTGKDYTLVVTDESQVKTDARTDRQSLRSDLKSTHDLIVDARKAVANAIRVSMSTLGGQTEE